MEAVERILPENSVDLIGHLEDQIERIARRRADAAVSEAEEAAVRIAQEHGVPLAPSDMVRRDELWGLVYGAERDAAIRRLVEVMKG
jgi:hypothetical protein